MVKTNCFSQTGITSIYLVLQQQHTVNICLPPSINGNEVEFMKRKQKIKKENHRTTSIYFNVVF